jgi:hypothetical protein
MEKNMENNVISIEQHKNYRKPTLWQPDRPECQVYDFSITKQRKRRQHQPQQRKMTVEEQVNDLCDKLADLQLEMLYLLGKARKGEG